jgi:predicted transcriptional regulator
MDTQKRKKRVTYQVSEEDIRKTIGEGNATRLSFSINLNKRLIENDAAQIELAKKTKLSMSSISDYRKGKAEPKITALNEIAKALDVSTDYLLGNVETKSPNPSKQAAIMYTDLSESAIDIIEKINNAKDASKTKSLSKLFEVGFITELVEAFCYYLDNREVETVSLIPGIEPKQYEQLLLKHRIEDAIYSKLFDVSIRNEKDVK